MSIYGKAILESKQTVNNNTNTVFYFTSEDEFKVGNKLPSNLINFYNKYPGYKYLSKKESLEKYLIDFKGIDGNFYYTKDNKSSLNKNIYIYKINKEYLIEELLEFPKLKDIIETNLHTKFESVNETEANYRKKVYNYCTSRLKTLSKDCKLSGKYLEIFDIEKLNTNSEWYECYEKNRIKQFLYDEFSNTHSLGILSGDLWKMNPNARTDEDLNNRIFEEINLMLAVIENELKTKFKNRKFVFEYTGDWDGLFFELVEKK